MAAAPRKRSVRRSKASDSPPAGNQSAGGENVQEAPAERVQVRLTTASWTRKRGSRMTVDADTADHLVRENLAVRT